MTPPRPAAPVDSSRDPAFDAAWRRASNEEPPAAVDAAIRAAALRAVAAGPQPAPVREATRPERWWWPLAAAATIGAVAIGILQLATPDRAGAPGAATGIVTDMPASAPGRTPHRAAAAGATTALRDERAPAAANAASGTPAGAPEAFPIATKPPPAPAASAPAQTGAPKAESPPAPRPKAEWIALIRKLRAEGKTEEFARELAAFRIAYPGQDRVLFDDLHNWRPAGN